MRSNRSSGTKPELVLAKMLRKRLTRSTLPGKPEFVYSREKLVVFVHGCWWHRCPLDAPPIPKTHAAFWRRKFERNVERDRLVTRELASMGWKVLIVWEHEVKRDPSKCVQRIRKALAQRKGVPKLHARHQ